MTEAKVQTKIKKKLEGLGWYVIRLAVTNVSGMPDLLALRKDCVPFFIEVKKTKGGILSPLQAYMLRLFNKLGFMAIEANSWEIVQQKLEDEKIK